MNAKSALATAAVAAAGVILSAGSASAAAPRISGHEQLRAGINAAVAAMPAEALTLPGIGPIGLVLDAKSV